MGPRGSFRRAVRVGLIVALPLSALTACDSLLEVDLPAQLTEDVLVDPAGVDAQINAVIGIFECGYSAWTLIASGMADVWDPLNGVIQQVSRYNPRPNTGDCDDGGNNDWSYYDQFTTSRAQAVGTYDRLTNLWGDNDVDDREQKQALMALYSAAVLDIFGEHWCEMALDAGPLMTEDETLAEGEMWIATALGHINNQPGGDFVIANGVATSAKAMAYGLRARMRWARNDGAGALADALLVPMGFTAWITRESALTRRNRQNHLIDSPLIFLYKDVNTYWQGTAPNPVTGQVWPRPIPFTGYTDLGILPDGRAVWDTGLPVRTAGVSRMTPAEDAAVSDTRVGTIDVLTSQDGLRKTPTKYPNADDDQPLVGWQEMWLLRAELEGGQAAIDRVNELRDFHSLPRVTYADPADAAEIRLMIIEERRRQLFLEGRFYATKIRNTDLLWFPRTEGQTPLLGFIHQGGIRKLMPSDEYDLNPNFTEADEATGCDPNERPTDF